MRREKLRPYGQDRKPRAGQWIGGLREAKSHFEADQLARQLESA